MKRTIAVALAAMTMIGGGAVTASAAEPAGLWRSPRTAEFNPNAKLDQSQVQVFGQGKVSYFKCTNLKGKLWMTASRQWSNGEYIYIVQAKGKYVEPMRFFDRTWRLQGIDYRSKYIKKARYAPGRTTQSTSTPTPGGL